MCTAVSYKAKNHYFGRNLDLEYTYQEAVTVTPRNYPFTFRKMGKIQQHFAIIGMAYINEGYPLYYDGSNEMGLSMAGLNFPGNAVYTPYRYHKDNIAPFELIPWILGQCATVSDAKKLLERINLLDENFSDELPLSPLHWIIADKDRSIVLESGIDGIKIHNNPVGVLTNNPPFDYHLCNLNNYMQLTRGMPKNTFGNNLPLSKYSLGMGAMGLPGDFSSMSRFVRAAFVKLNSHSEDDEADSVSQFFHILKAVQMPKGCVELENGLYEFTRYSSCCNTDKGIYYYTTYGNNQICAVDMHKEDLDTDQLIWYSLQKCQAIAYQDNKNRPV